VAFGADDENECTRAVVLHLLHVSEVTIFGVKGDSWPRFSADVGTAVASGAADFGVLMCWTGTGTSIAASKVPGVRAALAWEPWIARHARLWNDANVLALSLKRLAPDVAVECVQAFLAVEAEDPEESASIDQIRDLLGLPLPLARRGGPGRGRAGAPAPRGCSPASPGRRYFTGTVAVARTVPSAARSRAPRTVPSLHGSGLPQAP
jgi:ribose 5-phosphate isomerase B